MSYEIALSGTAQAAAVVDCRDPGATPHPDVTSRPQRGGCARACAAAESPAGASQCQRGASTSNVGGSLRERGASWHDKGGSQHLHVTRQAHVSAISSNPSEASRGFSDM